MYEYRRINANDESELQQCLQLLLAQPGQDGGSSQVRAQNFARIARSEGYDLSKQYLALEGGRIVASCLAICNPGRTALILSPRAEVLGRHRDAAVEAIRLCVRKLSRQRVRLFQAMLEQPYRPQRQILLKAGFTDLAELLYMVRPASAPRTNLQLPKNMAWVSYNSNTHADFAETIQRTYEQSLDCPELTGVRDIEDIIAGHKATGRFNPLLWSLLLEDGKPIGCVLTSPVPLRAAVELVYMGLIAPARGRGLGKLLLTRAIELAHRELAPGHLLA